MRYRFCRPDGQVIHLNESAVPMFGENDEVLYYRGATQDVTDQVNIEERYRTIVESAVEAIITIDSGGIIQSFNRAAEILFQYSRGEVIGLNVKVLMPAEHAEKHDGYLLDYLTSRQAKIIGIGREVEAQRKDGAIFPAFLSVSQHEVGNKISYTGLLRDITEQKQVEASLVETKNEAERANRAKSEFLSSMSHELRTPLNAILGFAQMLEYNPGEPLSPKQQESVGLIKRGGDHLLTLINEVLELAKIEAGRVDLSIETIDLSHTIEECATIARATATDRGIKLTYASDGTSLPNIEADNTRLKQVLLNLLSNAVKYNKDAGSITIDAMETEDDFVRISVADTGIGLSEREKKKVFEPFERLGKQSKDIEGTGIGLSITKQLIEMMNGRLGFESKIGEGSTFWIELPVSFHIGGQHHEGFGDDFLMEISGAIANPESSYSVLYVEDNKTNAQLMAQVFEVIPNAALDIVQSARAGIQHAKTNKPDLVLMDINLPDMSGFDAAKILKRTAGTRHIPIIAISASVWRAESSLIEDLGFYEYVAKPFDIIKIHGIIQSALVGKPD
ncbi:MAG: PAS domain S-box protein [Alphaproteobacteria bacterium]|nr:PAS domain S-box protein [Alphaproteobacteria bacterium]